MKNKTAYGVLAAMGAAVIVSSVTGTAIPGSDYVLDVPGYAIMLVLGLMLAGVF